MLLQFEYFYGNEAEDFTFYRIPKKIIKPLHLLKDLINASDEVIAITSIENFKIGFRLGVQMICDSLICDDGIFKDL